MIIFKRSGDLAGWLQKRRAEGRSIGFVPTMGALHEGHMSLIDISKRSVPVTVCSIFVNPAQFNDPRDFQQYPVTLEEDIFLLEKAGVDALYLPAVDEVYPAGMKDLEKYDLGRLETILEGKFRPGHFQGVCQVMRRLLDLVSPDHLFMGQKDYQQCMVIRRLLQIMGSPTILHPCPIVREEDGLAMSSRNRRLTPEQRKKATAIYQALTGLKEAASNTLPAPTYNLQAASAAPGSAAIPFLDAMQAPLDTARHILESNDFRIDYIELAQADDLEPLSAAAPPEVIALIAAFQGEVRLIDNLILKP